MLASRQALCNPMLAVGVRLDSCVKAKSSAEPILNMPHESSTVCGLSRPPISITMRTGTNVVAMIGDEPAASVFVQARGRNIV